MKLPPVFHRWALKPARAIRLQRELAGRIRHEPLPSDSRWIAGADMAFSADGQRCVAGVVLWDRLAGQVVETQTAVRRVRFPYIPGLLSFREAPAVLAALRRLKQPPHVLILDGHGEAHPRRMGLACHVGLLSGIPTVGCAKSRLCGAHEEPRQARGASTALMDGSDLIGAVVRSRTGVKCVYVSVGHRASLDDAVALVLACTKGYRLPEPTRLAHQLVTRNRRHV
jgi:deoxyribonuclease V